MTIPVRDGPEFGSILTGCLGRTPDSEVTGLLEAGDTLALCLEYDWDELWWVSKDGGL